MPRVQLIHWHPDEVQERARRLKGIGYEVSHGQTMGPEFLRMLRADPPAAIVIDLGRLPSQGRDVALAVRRQKSTRHLPIVFVDGEPEKVAHIQEKIPDAVYTTWNRMGSSLKKAIAQPPQNPVVPESVMAGYSGRPLSQKLGIKANSSIGLIHAPPDFETTVGSLPEGARFRTHARGRCDMIICFVRLRKELDRQVRALTARDDFKSIWFAWPKRASGMTTDVTQQTVREVGLAAGLVDYKICAIDATWSGLLFARRGESKGKTSPDRTRPSRQ